MVFSVYEQGLRINTPWETVFPQRGVHKTHASAATSSISPENIDKYSRHPNPPPQRKASGGLKFYQQLTEQQQQQRSKIYLAEQIMSSPVISLKADSNLDEAWQSFEQHRFHHLPVVNEQQQLQGVVSEKDILLATSKLTHPLLTNYRYLSVKDVMSQQVLTARPDTEVRQLAEVMSRLHIGCIPLLNGHGGLEGIVTSSDILRTIMHQAPLELWS